VEDPELEYVEGEEGPEGLSMALSLKFTLVLLTQAPAEGVPCALIRTAQCASDATNPCSRSCARLEYVPWNCCVHSPRVKAAIGRGAHIQGVVCKA